jgi:hypothetical protein
MKVQDKLRNSLIRKIQKLPSDKLSEVSKLFGQIERDFKSKKQTLAMAGSWKNIDAEVFTHLTDNLHKNRIEDRQF